MSGLRFAMVTTFYPPHHFGGDAIAVQRLAHGLARRGHQVTVVHDVGAHRLLGGTAAPTHGPAPDGVEVIGLQGSLAPIVAHQTGRPLIHGRRLRRILAEREVDVIHFHNISLLGPGVLSLGDGLKLLSVHDHWLVCPTHVLWRHGRELCDSRECLRCVLRHGRPPQLWRATGLLERELAQVDAFLAPSGFCRDKHAEFGFPHAMQVLPCFLAPDGQAAGTDVSPHERPYFLFVGRLERIKGLDEILPVFDRYPDADLLVAGEGSHGEELRRLARERGHDRVRFLGRLDADALVRCHRHALALIAPSVCFETFGLVVIEALAQGTPVIARELGSYPEILATSQAGLLFTGDDDLLAAMDRIQAEPGLRDELGRRGRAAVAGHWSEAAALERYLSIVRQVAERRGVERVVDALVTAPD